MSSSLPALDPKPRTKRISLQLNRLSSSRKSTGQRKEDPDEIARVRKAAAWAWHTRGIGEVVVPTKRVMSTLPSSSTKNSSSSMQRPASRFKAEATSTARNHPSSAHPPTAGRGNMCLYDEFELSSMKSHMELLVQQLQQGGGLQKREGHLETAATHYPHEPINHNLASSLPAFPQISRSRRPFSAIVHKLFPRISTAIRRSSVKYSHHGLQTCHDDFHNLHHEVHHHVHHYHHYHRYDWEGPQEITQLGMIPTRRHSESCESQHIRTWEAPGEPEASDGPRRRRCSLESFASTNSTDQPIKLRRQTHDGGEAPPRRRGQSDSFPHMRSSWVH